MHKAGGQSFRFRKDLGLPNQVCLFRQAQHNVVAMDLQRARRYRFPPVLIDDVHPARILGYDLFEA